MYFMHIYIYFFFATNNNFPFETKHEMCFVFLMMVGQ